MKAFRSWILVLFFLVISDSAEVKPTNASLAFISKGKLIAPVNFRHLTLEFGWKSFFSDVRAHQNDMAKKVEEWTKHHSAEIAGQGVQYHAHLEAALNGKVAELEGLLGVSRSTRNAFGFLGNIIAVGLGFSNTEDIDTLEENQKLVFKQEEVTRHLLGAATQELRDFQAKVVEGMDLHSLLRDLDRGFGNLEEAVSRLEDAVYDAAQGEVNKLFLPPTAAKRVQSHFIVDVVLSKVKVVSGGGSLGILKVPKSIILGSHGARIVLHVPMVASEVPELDLLELGSSTVVVNGSVSRLHGHKPFYAVDANKNWGLALDTLELARCSKVGHTWVCHDQRVLHRGAYECVSSIYHSKPLEDMCSFETYDVTREHLVHVGNDLYAGKTEEVALECPLSKEKEVVWGGETLVKVDQRCEASGEKVRIFSLWDPSKEDRHLLRNITVTPEIGPPSNFSSWESLATTIQDVPEHIESLKSLDHGKRILLFTAFGLIALVVVLMGAIAFFAQCYLRRKLGALTPPEETAASAIDTIVDTGVSAMEQGAAQPGHSTSIETDTDRSGVTGSPPGGSEGHDAHRVGEDVRGGHGGHGTTWVERRPRGERVSNPYF